jgi:hypothetical protein
MERQRLHELINSCIFEDYHLPDMMLFTGKIYRRFGGIYSFHFRGSKSKPSNTTDK